LKWTDTPPAASKIGLFNVKTAPMNANQAADKTACTDELLHLRGDGCCSRNGFIISVHSESAKQACWFL
jgi:hypothetical protein